MEMCFVFGIVILVGKDLLFMCIIWNDEGEDKLVILLMLGVIIVFVFVIDVCKILMFELKNEELVFVCIDFFKGQFCLGGFIFVQVYKVIGLVILDVDSFDDFKVFFVLV